MANDRYIIVRQAAQFPAAADTWTVVYGDDNEAISHHETEAEARAAVNGYKSHDRRRCDNCRHFMIESARSHADPCGQRTVCGFHIVAGGWHRMAVDPESVCSDHVFDV